LIENTPTAAQSTESVAVEPTEALSVIPTTALEVPSSYTVHRGEFPYCLARRFNVNPVTLLSVNGLNAGFVLHEGMTLKIPKNSDFPGKTGIKEPTPPVTRVSSGIRSIPSHANSAMSIRCR